jgi:hypothetical protein
MIYKLNMKENDGNLSMWQSKKAKTTLIKFSRIPFIEY